MNEDTSPTIDQTVDIIGARIVESAAKLFAREGFEKTSTIAIATRAQTSKREIYSRFPDKEKLFESVIRYLCSLAETQSEESQSMPTGLSEFMKVSAQAVITRFVQVETQGILVAAIAARPRYPSIIEIFWDNGPGLAVDAIANEIIRNKPKTKALKKKSHEAAHWYILECFSPFVTRQLFDGNYKPSDVEISAHLEKTTDSFFSDYAQLITVTK